MELVAIVHEVVVGNHLPRRENVRHNRKSTESYARKSSPDYIPIKHAIMSYLRASPHRLAWMEIARILSVSGPQSGKNT